MDGPFSLLPQTTEPGGDPIARLRLALSRTRPDADVDMLRRAYEVAAHCHAGQTRCSGDAYVTHPVTVATILAGLGADDQTLCAAILHDTVDDTPYTLTALSREFGGEIGAMIAGVMALDSIRGRRGRKVARAMAALGAADTRVVAMKLADRLHNMQTLRFLPEAKQLRKAREVLDIFVPIAEQLSLVTVTTELETLAAATLARHRFAGATALSLSRQPVPRRRVIVALDIERSTRRPDLVKAELRETMYGLFHAALWAAGIRRRHRDPFADRGDGFLALIHSADQAPEMLLKRVVPAFGMLLAEYNASHLSQLRVRVVIHAGQVFYDANGCFGVALDTAFRLLDAAQVKQALQDTPASHVLVVSDEIYRSGGVDQSAFRHPVSVQVGASRHYGWIGQ